MILEEVTMKEEIESLSKELETKKKKDNELSSEANKYRLLSAEKQKNIDYLTKSMKESEDEYTKRLMNLTREKIELEEDKKHIKSEVVALRENVKILEKKYAYDLRDLIDEKKKAQEKLSFYEKENEDLKGKLSSIEEKHEAELSYVCGEKKDTENHIEERVSKELSRQRAALEEKYMKYMEETIRGMNKKDTKEPHSNVCHIEIIDVEIPRCAPSKNQDIFRDSSPQNQVQGEVGIVLKSGTQISQKDSPHKEPIIDDLQRIKRVLQSTHKHLDDKNTYIDILLRERSILYQNYIHLYNILYHSEDEYDTPSHLESMDTVLLNANSKIADLSIKVKELEVEVQKLSKKNLELTLIINTEQESKESPREA